MGRERPVRGTLRAALQKWTTHALSTPGPHASPGAWLLPAPGLAQAVSRQYVEETGRSPQLSQGPATISTTTAWHWTAWHWTAWHWTEWPDAQNGSPAHTWPSLSGVRGAKLAAPGQLLSTRFIRAVGPQPTANGDFHCQPMTGDMELVPRFLSNRSKGRCPPSPGPRAAAQRGWWACHASSSRRQPAWLIAPTCTAPCPL